MVRALQDKTPMQENRPTDREFMFATGIENSYPTILWDKKVVRRDGMELSGHYDRWRDDFDIIKELGIRFLRYGPPFYRCSRGHCRYDFSLADEPFRRLRQLRIHPITDLCHFGVPDWLGDFQNPEFPEAFADYARAFARRFPWVKLYTPVNEIYIAADFSGLRGWWNERLKSDRGFVTALKHLVKANLLAQKAILEIQPKASFIQSESTTYYHQRTPLAHQQAFFHNQRRFLSLDLNYGNDVSGIMLEYLLDNGMSRHDYHWFMTEGRAMTPHCIMGNDYYSSNEYWVQHDEQTPEPSGEIFGYYVITHQYFERYRLPVMHTETNLKKSEHEAVNWLRKEWANVVRLKQDGVPIMGFTWYSLIDQTDWDTALCEINHRTNPCGLYDKNRRPHPVADAYKELIAQWRHRLPREELARELHLEHDEAPVQGPADGQRPSHRRQHRDRNRKAHRASHEPHRASRHSSAKSRHRSKAGP